MPNSLKEILWRQFCKSIAIVSSVILPNFNAFFFLESYKSLSLWDISDWVAIKLLFKSDILVSFDVIIDKIGDISIGYIEFIKLSYYRPLVASVFVPFRNYKRVILVLNSNIFFELSICICNHFGIYTLNLSDFLIKCVYGII